MIESLYMTLAEREKLDRLSRRLGLEDRPRGSKKRRERSTLDREAREEIARYLMRRQSEAKEENSA